MLSPSVSYRQQMPAEQIMTEEALVQAAQHDSRKFEALYNKYFEPVFRFVYQRVEQKQNAADITSQVFLKAMLNLPKYEYRGLPFNAWLFRIAKNELTDMFRKRRVERVINVETDALKEVMDEMKEDSYEIYYGKLTGVMKTLKDEDLDLVEMRFFEKRSFKEIGDILGITENNAKVKLYRLLDRMKSLITNKK